MGFQQTVNINAALGIPGELSFDGPLRATQYIINSNGATPNLVGNAYTISGNANPDPTGSAPVGGTAQCGGTGVFAGILISPKEYPNFGVTGNPLGATLAIPDYTEGSLCIMGQVFVNMPGPANAGDLVTYDSITGNLNSIPATVAFTAAIAPGGSAGVNDVMTVSAITAGSIQVGMQVSGSTVAGSTFVASYGTGKGGTGTYNLTSINEQTVSSAALTGNGLPAPAFVGAGYIVGTTMTITTATSGDLVVGSQVLGTGVLPNTVITAYGSGVGGTGTYTVSQSQTVASSGSPEALTSNKDILIARCVVDQWGASAAGGVAAIRITQ